MAKPILVLTLFLSLNVLVVSWKDAKKETELDHTQLGVEKADLALNDAYQCHTDCENGKTYDKEGLCSVCNVLMKKVEKERKDENESNHKGHNHD